jgi:endonuclease/exonuclease/phosphatase family metal-dependent hydrolase
MRKMRFSFFTKKKKKPKFTVAFYNLENLFDPEDHAQTLDEDFTPNGFKKWTPQRYHRKLGKLARTIGEIGKEHCGYSPILVGVAEVENGRVIQDLLQTDPLRDMDYDYVHYESPDERGIDTALIYRTKYFKIFHSEPLPLLLQNEEGQRDTTRDILYIHGTLNEEEVHVFVNHWPSRRAGTEETAHKRIQAAEVVKRKIQELHQVHVNPNVLVMGDFNDDPKSQSIQSLLTGSPLINPMEQLHMPKERGSSNYKRKWSLFDQIMVSHSFLNYNQGTHSFDGAHIFDHVFLMESEGKYKGSPFRTYAGEKYLGGYSDHFPVYVILTFNP